jgi:hypothetical protein
VLGGVAIGGCGIAAICDLVGLGLSEQIGMVRHTISNLAANSRSNYVDELVDAGLFAFALAVIATSVGLLRWRIARRDWKIGAILLVIVALCVALIAGYEAYSSGHGPQIHYKLVYVLGVAFPLAVLLTAGQFREISNPLGLALYGGGALWLLMAPLLFVVPTGYDGAYERVLAALMLAWFVTMGVMIWRNPDVTQHVDDSSEA